MNDEGVLVGYQALSQHGGMWFFIREVEIARAYYDMGYKVRVCRAFPYQPEDEVQDAVSRSDRQHDPLNVCGLPDEGTIPSYREPAPERPEAD